MKWQTPKKTGQLMRQRKQYHGKPGTKSLRVVKSFFPKVTKIVDATKELLVEVTDADNMEAERKDHRVCAYAIACKRTTHADGVIIGLTTSYVINGKTAVRYKNTGSLSREITSFDRQAKFDPGFYRVIPPSPAHTLGYYKGHPTHPRSNNKPDRRKFRHFTGGVRTVLGQYEPPAVSK